MIGRRTAIVAWSVASVLAFGVVAWRADGAFARSRYPAAPSAAESAALEATLTTYHEIYQDLFASEGTPDLLNDFPATAAVKHLIFRDLGYLREAGLVHVQDLASARVLSATLTAPGRAEVVVLEEWNTMIQRAGDRTPVSKLAGMGQGFRYVLVRDGDRWLVAGWNLEDVTGAAGPVEAGR